MSQFKIPHSKPYLPPETKELVNQVLDSGWLTSGPMVERFEQSLSERTGFKHVICTSSGTTALNVSAQYLYKVLKSRADYKHEPLLVMPTFTYSATANAILPIFSESDSRFIGCSGEYPMVNWGDFFRQTRHFEMMETLFVEVSIAGRQPSKHLEEIEEIDSGWAFLDDCAHCIPMCNDVLLLHISCTSFWPSKMITTGEGGCAFTSNDAAAEYIRKNISHSIETSPFPWNRKCTSFGATNYRMSDISAAVGLAQFQNFEYILESRQQASDIYGDELGDLMFPDKLGDQHQMLLIQVDPIVRDSLVMFLRANSIEASVHYDPPLHRQACYKEIKRFNYGNFDHFSGCLVTLPIYVDMAPEDIRFVCDHVKQFLKSCPTTTLN